MSAVAVTFSRHTLPAAAVPVDGEAFTFTDFSGEPQIFLTLDQLLCEMRAAGFEPEQIVPRYLPYSFRGALPPSRTLTRMYLRTRPAWRLLGKQFLVIGRR